MSCWRQSSPADYSPAAVWVLGGHEGRTEARVWWVLSFLVVELQSHGGAKQITLIGYGLLVTGTGLLNKRRANVKHNNTLLR